MKRGSRRNIRIILLVCVLAILPVQIFALENTTVNSMEKPDIPIIIISVDISPETRKNDLTDEYTYIGNVLVDEIGSSNICMIHSSYKTTALYIPWDIINLLTVDVAKFQKELFTKFLYELYYGITPDEYYMDIKDDDKDKNAWTSSIDWVANDIGKINSNDKDKKKYIFFVTDGGGVEGSSWGQERAFMQANENNIECIIIGTGDTLDNEYLQEITQGLNGRYFDALKDTDKIIEYIHTIGLEKQGQYIQSRRIGYMYEQTVDIDEDTLIPQINSVKATLIDQSTNTYSLTIEDFECDSNGKAFFYWKADEALFTSASEDFKQVECIIDKGISGRNIPITVYIGDCLGHVTSYKVWIKAN